MVNLYECGVGECKQTGSRKSIRKHIYEDHGIFTHIQAKVKVKKIL